MDDWRSNLPPELRGLSDELSGFVANLSEEVDPGFEDNITEVLSESAESPDALRLSFLETLRQTVAVFGGASGIAKEYNATYRSAPAGSPVRSTIINNVMKALQDYGEDVSITDEESIEAIEEEIKSITTAEILDKLPEELQKQVAAYIK